ncbi:sodium-dependent nutrient amino acid transporter 1-like [Schistocerca americana]|uniref:sodium-dependent nutrient amino acid transporter 1-like n=1 Tax=Schistocerca americana TaxID=7009 RepID=UPI001F4FA46A|nr:sodium-dependent nutrient amino acid transporter 1-like [Schistocerca americana]
MRVPTKGSDLGHRSADLELGTLNKAYVIDATDPVNESPKLSASLSNGKDAKVAAEAEADGTPQRAQWGNQLEFLMSCIAMSVGLGNVWRFPFTAYENGGGAFLIPYIIVLFVIGKPLYYMEMALGQFTSYGPIKVWYMVPALKGIGYGQALATIATLTYYCSLMAITSLYFVLSFSSELPWAKCLPEWEGYCIDSTGSGGNFTANNTDLQSSSELFFLKYVLNEVADIAEGIGVPDWRLTIGLAVTWITIFFVVWKGVKSSGKASYFLALFPYVIMIVILIRGATLPGAGDGILFFITPQWDRLLTIEVWYAAITQSFFSLTVCFGPLIMYSSYNDFNHNVHRDALIVTTLDTCTSILAGCTIFSILGNLAYEMGIDDISAVVNSGTGLAFISYPDAIAKFEFVPQLFAVLFFFMLFVLGVGSAVALDSAVNTIIRDDFPSIKQWMVAALTCVGGFLTGLVYITPAGQWILNLVDYYNVTLTCFVLASIEMAAVAWIYGMDNFCQDVEFMLGHRVGMYWRICWGFITPVVLILVLIYSLVTSTPLTYTGKYYDDASYVAAWTVFGFSVLQCPLWILYILAKNRSGRTWKEAFRLSFTPSAKWGPKNDKRRGEWLEFKANKKREIQLKDHGIFKTLIFRYLGCGRP